MSHFMQSIKKAFYLIAAIGFSSAIAGSYDDFFRASQLDDGYTLRRLIERGFDANSRGPDGQTALFSAMQEGNFKVAEALLAERSLDVNLLNANDESALMMAALKGHTDWVRRLLDRGAQVNKTGWSPLHYAASGPEPAITKLLLARGAKVDAESPNRTTPLMMAARYGSEDHVGLLLAAGADRRARNDLGLDAAQFARQAKRDELAARIEQSSR
jgi:ankyrin repeat protein